MDDHYKTLGIEKTASLDEIKKAYRKLAMKYHPDRTDGDQEKFQQIKHAYEILSDPKNDKSTITLQVLTIGQNLQNSLDGKTRGNIAHLQKTQRYLHIFQ